MASLILAVLGTATSLFAQPATSNPEMQMHLATCTLGPPMPLNGSVDGFLDAQTLSDMWCIQPADDGLLHVTVAVAYQVTLTLFESNGSTILTTGNNADHAITFGLGPGTYYVRVQLVLANDSGPYTLTNTFVPPGGPNDNEHNDSAGSAQPLSLPADTGGHLGYHWDGVDDLRDYFRVDPTSAGMLTVTLETDGFDALMHLRNEADQILTTGGDGSVGSLSYFVEPGTYYIEIVKVLATDAGSYAMAATGVSSGGTPPSPPSDLLATALSATTTSLAWTDNSSDETGFKIERKTGASGTYSQVALQGMNLNFFNDSALTASTQYCYRVRATNSAGDSAYSNESCATTDSTGSLTADFAWSPAAPLAGETVQYTDQSTGSPTSWNWTFGDGGMSTGQNPSHVYQSAGSYQVVLSVSNSSGSTSSATQQLTVTEEGPPSAFTLIASSYCNGSTPAVRLTWSLSLGATGYVIYLNGAAYTTMLPPTQDNYSHEQNVTAGQTYSYSVQASNSYGTTDSNTVLLTVPADVCQQSGQAADLRVLNVLAPPVSALPAGETLVVRFTVRNEGQFAPGDVVHEVRLSQNNSTAFFDGLLLGSLGDTCPSGGDSRSYLVRLTIPAETSIGRYYVKVKTNATQTVHETDLTNNVGASSTPLTIVVFGTTVITHGYQFDGMLPDWPGTMAGAILQRVGRGTKLIYNRSTGRFGPPGARSTPGETILIFDWAFDSYMHQCNLALGQQEGYSEAAGEALFTALVAGYRAGTFDLRHLHFIGHSRGTVVNSEAAERLFAAGFPVEQITMLDPVDQGVLDCLPDDDVNSLHGITAGVVAWEGIGSAETYYRDNDALCPFSPINIASHAIPDTRNVDLSDRDRTPGLRTGISHCGVHAWYHFTIDVDEPDSDGDGQAFNPAWFGSVESGCDSEPYRQRQRDGFFFTRLGGGFGSCPQLPSRTPAPVQFDRGSAREGLVNGDFERQGGFTPGDVPGWSLHGGGGNAGVAQGSLVLGTGDEQTHNRMWIPFDARVIAYELCVPIPSATDELVVSVGTTDLVRESLTATGCLTRDVEVSAFRSTIQTFTFSVQGDGGALVSIDNVHFEFGDVMNAPLLVRAVAVSPSQIDLAWIRNSTAETGFEIQRRVEAEGWGDIAIVAPRTISFTDSTLRACETRAYRIRALGSTGNSEFSNVIVAHTSGCRATVPPRDRTPVALPPRP
jgi:PKD repeat protein